MTPARASVRLLRALVVAAILVTTGIARMSAEPADEPSLVEVLVTFQENDPFQPWQTRPPGVRRGYGVLCGKNRFLTTENLVRNARLVEVRRARSGQKIAATVERSDIHVNLALVQFPEGKGLEGPESLPIAEHVEKHQKLTMLQLNETSQIQRGNVEVVSISVAELPTAPYPVLVFSLLADLNVNGEGAAVVSDGALAGLTMSYDPNARIARMVPYPILRRFLEAATNPPYQGFPTAGVAWAPLVDPVKRAYLQAPATNQGILVTSCLPGTGAAATLKPMDVILAWDRHAIDNLGLYSDEEFGRLGFAHLIKGRRNPGDVVPVSIIRDGKALDVEVTLDRWRDENSLIPEDVDGQNTAYLIEGGLAFQELTGRFLRTHGRDWQVGVDTRLVHTYLTQRQAPRNPGDHVVLLTGVMPDPINIGYQHLQYEVVTHANGTAIANLDDLFRIREKDGLITRVTLQSVGVDLVLDASDLPAANARILDLYRLPALARRAAREGTAQKR